MSHEAVHSMGSFTGKYQVSNVFVHAVSQTSADFICELLMTSAPRHRPRASAIDLSVCGLRAEKLASMTDGSSSKTLVRSSCGLISNEDGKI
jgi:hypothetical protein